MRHYTKRTPSGPPDTRKNFLGPSRGEERSEECMTAMWIAHTLDFTKISSDFGDALDDGSSVTQDKKRELPLEPLFFRETFPH